ASLSIVVRRVEDVARVDLDRVVGQHGTPPATGGGQVPAAGTQVLGGGEGGVVEVVRVGDPVLVGVDLVVLPGARDELHRTDRVVVGPVAVVPAGIGVQDG